MKTFRRWTLLGSFAALGVGVAICVGMSTGPGADGSESTPPEPAVAASAGVCNQVAAKPQAASQPAHSGLAIPSGPLAADVLPPRTQQFVPMDKSQIQALVDTVRQMQSKQSQAATTAAAAAQVPPAAPLPPAVATPPAAAVPQLPPGLVAPPMPLPPQDDRRGPPPAARPAKSDRPATKSVGTINDGKITANLQNEDIHNVLDMLAEQGKLNILAGKSVQGTVSATLNGVDLDSALAAILKSTGFIARREGKFIFVGTPEEFETVEQSWDKVNTRVYKPNYVAAAELQALITPLLTPKTGIVSVSAPSKAGIATDDANAEGNTFAGGEVVVVRDYEAVLLQVDQLVNEIDLRPMQVSIEAMILSVKLSDDNRFGVNFQLLRDQKYVRFALGQPLTDLGQVKFDGGLKFGFLDSSLGVFLQALETIGDVHVVATPRLMVINKHRAEVLIGAQKGYVDQTVTETATTQTVKFLDVGTLLRLRPFISSDGLIRMEVHPELSDGDVVIENNLTLPNKEVTKVTTNIMVRDGCTVIIGGLMHDQMTNVTSAVPFLGALPLVGVAFRQTDEKLDRQEVLVMLTPHIVYEPESCQEGKQASCEFIRRQSVYADKMTCLNRRNIARRYFRLAQAAYAAGDRDTALRFAEMAVHFDPLSRAAIDLRADIWQGKTNGDHLLQDPAAAISPAGNPPSGNAPGGHPLDGESISPWVLNDLEHAPPAPVTHPADPGTPGGRLDLKRPRSLE